MTIIFSHRGLNPAIKDFPSESSYEAFKIHLSKGYGLEFDLSFLSDGNIGIIHDADLSRITSGQDKRLLQNLTKEEFCNLRISNNRFVLLPELLEMMQSSGVKLHAMHFKGKLQTNENINKLIKVLESYPAIINSLLIFDLMPSSAVMLHSVFSDINFACSVAKSYDIQRYNSCTANTLLSLDQYYKFKNIYNWVWLDEWDVLSPSGEREELYTEDVFAAIKKHGAKIALVTPELHASSPGLLGGEAHQDAKTFESLQNRIVQILKLKPDAICTDYPELILSL